MQVAVSHTKKIIVQAFHSYSHTAESSRVSREETQSKIIFLKEELGWPTDIFFNVIEKDEEEKEDSNKAKNYDNDKTAEIKAHKFILAPVE